MFENWPYENCELTKEKKLTPWKNQTINKIEWENPDLCYHIIDYCSPLDEKDKIIDRLSKILNHGLLTSRELKRRKNFLEVSPETRLDVFSTKMRWTMWENPKEDLINIIQGFWTTINLLLEAEHEEFSDYPHSLIIEWINPKILALIVNKKSAFIFESNFCNKIEQLADDYWVLLLNSELEKFERPEVTF